MMLTGQVFAIMSETATDGQVRAITQSADRYLYQKENGAVFSHMAVMYANALYRRGFVQEGHRALQALADAALNFETSKIYPGIPEYFNGDGRGVYHYLTGAASWYMMTMITKVYGVRGENGDLVICPKLVRSQFDENREASITLPFGGKQFAVRFVNINGKDYGQYHVTKACMSVPGAEGMERLFLSDGSVTLRREEIRRLPEGVVRIIVELL